MIVVITGPTATGKTALSVRLAHALGEAGTGSVQAGCDASELAIGNGSGAEIISADAMALYRGMDIGTAKPTVAERGGVPHHQIDVLDVHEDASVAAYQRHARADLEGILARGKTPIVVGGSGLYVAGLLDEIDFPGTDPALRAELNARLEAEGAEALHRELAEVDPVSAATIDVRNTRRIVRALEVVRLTGRSFTPRFPRHTPHYPDIVWVALHVPDRADRERIIAARTRAMFDDGLVEETRALIPLGLRESRTASRATGYAEALAVIDGTMTREEAEASVTAATLALTKKQRTWFKADKRITWFEAPVDSIPESLVDMLTSR